MKKFRFMRFRKRFLIKDSYFTQPVVFKVPRGSQIYVSYCMFTGGMIVTGKGNKAKLKKYELFRDVEAPYEEI